MVDADKLAEVVRLPATHPLAELAGTFIEPVLATRLYVEVEFYRNGLLNMQSAYRDS